jgi:hypothetical protein
MPQWAAERPTGMQVRAAVPKLLALTALGDFFHGIDKGL